MRLRSTLTLGSIGVVLTVLTGVHCDAGGGGTKTGGTGGNTGGPGSGGDNPFATSSGAGGLGFPMSTGAGGSIVPDDDPTNPNITHPTCAAGTCGDFPANPLLGDGVPANVATLFGAADNFSSGALCVLEPELSAAGKEGAMLPANWVRPRFRVAAAGLDLFEIRMHSPAEAHDLVAYTKQPTWYLPKDIWAGPADVDAGLAGGTGLANNGAGAPITVTIRGINSSAPGVPVGIKGDFNIAPVIATGSMVFWTVNSAAVTPQSSKLLGFTIGDEGAAEALKLTDLEWGGQIGEDGAVLRGYYDNPKLPGFVNGQVRCMGCHTSTPDGQGVLITDDWPWAKAAAMLTSGSVGKVPGYLGKGAEAVMKMPWWGTQTMSAAHWKAGDRTLVTSYATTFKSGKPRNKPWQALPFYDAQNSANDDKVKWHKLAWIDLESTASIDVAVTSTPDYGNPLNLREMAAAAAQGTTWDLIATGDSNVSEVSPSMSHAGDKIVYTTTDFSPDGHPDTTAKTSDVKVVDYNNRLGGVAKAVPGASDPGYLEYYPSFSADDKLIAFTRAPNPTAASPDGPYYNRFGEAMIIPAEGGTPVSLAANVPNACGGDDVSKGIINSWPKWSPDAFTAHGKTYYFVIFSSARKYKDEFSEQFSLPTNPLSAFKGLNASSQLYLAAVVVDKATGKITTYPAVYIWNQNRTPGAMGNGVGIQFSNLTPAWDPFKLPPLIIDMVPTDVPK